MSRYKPSTTPVLGQQTYCSEACGFGCLKVAYDNCVAEGNRVLNLLGEDDWELRVCEQAGWFSEITHKTIPDLKVWISFRYQESSEIECYNAKWGFLQDFINKGQGLNGAKGHYLWFEAKHKTDPLEAIRMVQADAKRFMTNITPVYEALQTMKVPS